MSVSFYYRRPSARTALFFILPLQLALLIFSGSGRASWYLAALTLLQPVPYLECARCFLLARSASKPKTVNRLDLKKMVRDHPDLVYLGQGFELKPGHTRYFHEIMDAGLAKTKGRGHGSYKIHGVEFRSNAVFQSLDDARAHTAVFGTTGAGKTRLLELMTAQAVMRHEAVIVFDPKGDRALRDALKASCNECQREFDFMELDLLNPVKSVLFEPLGSWRSASEVADRITSLMSASGSAASFKAYANTAVTAAVIVLKKGRKTVTLAAIRAVLGNFQAFYTCISTQCRALRLELNAHEVNVYADRIFQNGDPKLQTLRSFYFWLCSSDYIKPDPELELLFSVAAMDRAYFEKVTAGVQPVLNSLCSGSLYSLLSSGEGISLGTVMRQSLVLYVSLRTLVDASTGSALGRLMLADLCASAGYAYDQDSKKGVSVYIDEASELMCESLVQLLNKSRGAGFSVTLATQTIADLTVRSGSSAASEQVLGNANTLISLRVIDNATAKKLVSSMPVTRIADRTSSAGYAEHDGTAGAGQISRGFRSREVPLFPPELLPLLPDFEYVARFADGRCVKGRLPLLKDGK